MSFVRFEVLTAVTMQNAVFRDITPCGSCKNRSFGGTHLVHHQGNKDRKARNNVSSNQQPKHAAKKYYVIVPSSRILVTLMMEVSSETSVLTRATRGNIPGDCILQSVIYCCFTSSYSTDTSTCLSHQFAGVFRRLDFHSVPMRTRFLEDDEYNLISRTIK
jgi:hypothetical protein